MSRNLPDGWQWGDPLPPSEDTMVVKPVADPWAGRDVSGEVRRRQREQATETVRRERSRRIYGRVYELFTSRPADGEHPYAGKVKAPKTIAQRRDEHIREAGEPGCEWKAYILPGKAGYRLLETIYATGDDRADEAALRRAEAFWIDKLRTTYNVVRPVRPPHGTPLSTRPADSRPARGATPRRAKRHRKPFPWRVLLFSAVTVPLMLMIGMLLAAVPVAQPWWDAVPFVAAFVGGPTLGWRVTAAVLRVGKRLRAWS